MSVDGAAKGLLFACFVMPMGASTAAAPPPPIAIHEPVVVFYSSATFDFNVPDFPKPIVVVFHNHTSGKRSETKFEEMIISYGFDKVVVGKDLLADIATPDLSTLSASAIHVEGSNEIVISVYLFDESPNCAARKEKPCGLIEFDWTIGGKLEKLDSR